jgi:hypothetical protein
MKPLGDETGVAMIMALAVMLIVTLLGSAAVLVATQTNSYTTRDSSSKEALEAADAGLRAASYRLSVMQPDNTHCVTNSGVIAPNYPSTSPTFCYAAPQAYGSQPADGSASLGNGTSYQYWMSLPLGTGAPCAGQTVINNQEAVANRCITAVGTANGVTARTEARVAAFAAVPLFPAAIVGYSAGSNPASVSIGNNANIGSTQNAAEVATNGLLSIGGGTTFMTGYETAPGAPPVSIGNGATTGTATAAPAPFVPTNANFGTAATNTAAGQSCAPAGTQATTNCDYRIANGLDPSSHTTFDPVTRVLTMSNNSSLTLGGGMYDFCGFSATNNAHITVGATVKTQIFIDSYYRILPDGSHACPQGTTGNFTMSQNDTLDNPSGDATAVQIYVYGNPSSPGSTSVTLYNNSNSYISLSAPYSAVTMNPSNNTSFTGAIAGNTVSIGNAAHFTFAIQDSSLQVSSQGLFYRTAWEQCPATASTSDPRSGC